ncbi:MULTISPECIES: NAD-glutamate dehydrogenase [unclassified Caulobacter]|uniref:NAD-glutamate dehydrogenase n=1 Tax=unclassified Caulobacter TaxID=2648921 RepID=UPI0006FF9668|nr:MULTISPECIES: NAD-glutamate dehydrogenase [unclassified Caulobacter]KQV62294.1 glutamate dehydrogenase [Caulobacter sp. Root342]KQV63214.1 glutamate dehydrogenase [Caulobacter sp. Root343]
MIGEKNDLKSAEAPIGPLVSAFAQALGSSVEALSPAARGFAAQAQDDWSAEELPGLDIADVARALADFWRFGESAKDLSEPAIRIRRAEGGETPSDLLEIVQPDRPFLVDSIMGEVTEAGFSVRAMFHPVADCGGVRRSMIQVWLAPVGEDREAALVQGVREALSDVGLAVQDFDAMRALMRRTIDELKGAQTPVSAEEKAEDLAFLDWLEGDHFVFLGARVYEYPRTADGGYAAEEPLYQPEGSLGVLRDQARTVLRRGSEPAILSAQVRTHIDIGDPIVVAKSNLRSRVHRRGYMDYVGVRRYGADGKAAGEVRFVGLFTAEAYETPAHTVPLVRRKVAHVLDRAGKDPESHNGKRLRNILETWPRDELFQTDEAQLLSTAMGVLHLYDRPRVKLFARRDPFDRFISVLLFVPRDRYDSGVRARAGAILAEAFRGRVSAYYPSFSDAPLARVHYILGVTPGDHADPDLAAVEAAIAETARTWDDRFEAAIRESSTGRVAHLLARYAGAFPPGYRDQYDAVEALADIQVIDDLAEGEAVRVRAFRRPDDSAVTFRFKLYRPGAAAPLADVLPILEHMGLKALIEDGFKVSPDGQPVWIHEFVLRDEAGEHLVFGDVKQAFEAAFVAIWTGRAESDGFNRLVLELGIGWREAALIRALARYRQQSGLDPSQGVQEQALSDHPGVARLILDLFQTKFDPAVKADLRAREDQAKAVEAKIVEALQAVESLDADRVLRRLAALVGAIQRTNFYQPAADGGPKPYISFKIASRELEDLPAPKPYREIYVSAPHVEGVHLRFGPVARGGLRWSDRRDDFRTEVLGLVKAQQVKNAVIVPVGSKGGFYPKQLPRGGDRDAIQTEAIRAYKTFLSGLLDLTDNIDPDNNVVPPTSVVVHDGEDPYLVVAADKGTATFSDIANGVAEDYGFWLGDAFASGGSVGYDHKVMGITARGAWEAVKRHFRELGKDIQSEPFTVVGVGDMSGDVFGNGMLLSKQTKLLAAFDHRHIFLDPNPDVAASWEERDRMFKLPRSSWDDYDKAKISSGGGVFARSLKSIPLSKEVRDLFEIKAEAVSPAELMTAILKSKAELLYLGGIGTYVKARGETNADAGDKANDAIRINGSDLRVKVVGEGANLGLTQAGRIEFAQAGGHINTDAIDNSAGVDSSDHEVNIKILTGILERSGELTRPDRNTLLASMTNDVGHHVLEHNYDQTLALTLLESDAASEVDAQIRYMVDLEQRGRLDRRVEGLPTNTTLLERKASNKGLTRPELAVLLAYGKLDLFDEIVASQAPDDPWFEATLRGYFPKALDRYADAMQKHRLKREIIATVVGNQMVNMCGPTFVSRLKAAAGADVGAVVVGFTAAREILGVDGLWDQVGALDNKASANGQTALYKALAYALRSLSFWLARRAVRDKATVKALVEAYGPAVAALRALAPAILSPFEQKTVAKRVKAYVADGAPETLAQAVAALQPLTTAADLVDLANASSWSVENVARLYHQVGAAFGFDRLRGAAGSFVGGDSFERLAVRRLIEDMLTEQTTITQAVLKFAANAQAGEDEGAAKSAISSWAALRGDRPRAVKRTIEDIEQAGGGWTFAKLTIANAALRELSTAA